MSFHPDGRQLVSGGYDKVVRLYDVARGGDAIKTFEGHQALVSRAVFSPHVSLPSVTSLCDSHLALSFQSGRFRFPSAFFRTRFADWLQGKLVITGSKDATLRIWDLTSGVCIQTLKKHLGAGRFVIAL